LSSCLILAPIATHFLPAGDCDRVEVPGRTVVATWPLPSAMPMMPARRDRGAGLRLAGLWLREAGFERGGRYEIELAAAGWLIIEAVRRGLTRAALYCGAGR
jgi:hypothetical protein